MKPVTRVLLSGVMKYSEETIDDENDYNCLDSVIGINWIAKGIICIHTEKKELVVTISNEPLVESIA
ncbi:hypothetical protein MED297_17423 [Reinekea sp. MED297]|uniref:Uncharacterized protein n=2 Tax=Reinekea TaxID=230494 RepID=A4BFQ0_9GAMM|nr:hypothetical protein MED297_17423 [Reinekea sp. MED297] [Reinekea blandensis MED297]